MISVTAYDKTGQDICYGRNVVDGKEAPEAVAEENARRLAADYISRRPESGPIEAWTFKQDACDRQVFQRSP